MESENVQKESPSIQYKRENHKRVFVNRSLNLSKIKFVGFDMDYTLAQYKSPEFEQLGFRLTMEHLIKNGYPKELASLEYDHTFAVRGLWFDSEYGNLLKVDAFGNILKGLHGFTFLNSSQINDLYPNKFVHLNDNRIYVLNTLFNLPETHLLACIIDHFDKLCIGDSEKQKLKHGVMLGDILITYRNIFQDVRKAVDYVHIHGSLKDLTVKDMEKYVWKDVRLPVMLDRLKEHGTKVFLLTNSGFSYSNSIMSYLLNSEKRDWRSYFDYIVVDAQKPLWFNEGTALRQVNTETGSCDTFSKCVGARGQDVLYAGDHIFGDVLRSKKTRGWRTFLIVPELQWELKVWREGKDSWDRLKELEFELGMAYKLELATFFRFSYRDQERDLDSGSKMAPDVSAIQEKLKETTHQMDLNYCLLGSLFRSGNRLTFFASQVERYADLYAGSCVNLLYYPFCYFFRAPAMLMPHESTVHHEIPKDEERDDPKLPPLIDRARHFNESKLDSAQKSAKTAARGGRAMTPRQSTFVHEDDEGGSSSANASDAVPEDNESDTESDMVRQTRTTSSGDDILVQAPKFSDQL